MLKTIAEVLKELDGKKAPPTHPSAYCCECKIPLRFSVTGCRKTKRGPMCSDCYFAILSDHINNHPIITPILEM